MTVTHDVIIPSRLQKDERRMDDTLMLVPGCRTILSPSGQSTRSCPSTLRLMLQPLRFTSCHQYTQNDYKYSTVIKSNYFLTLSMCIDTLIHLVEGSGWLPRQSLDQLIRWYSRNTSSLRVDLQCESKIPPPRPAVF